MKHLIKKLSSEKRNIFSIMSTSILGSIVSLIMVLSFANLLDATSLGVYQYIISIVSIIGAISLTGIPTTLVRAISKKDYSFMLIAKKWLWIGSLGGIAVAGIISLYYLYKINFGFALSIFVGTILYLWIQVLYRFTALFAALEKVKTLNHLLKLHALSPLFFVLPALFLTTDPHILAILYFTGNLVSFIVGIYFLKMKDVERTILTHISEDVSTPKKNRDYFMFSIHQSFISLFNTAGGNIDKIILFQMLGPEQTAMYYIATSVPNRLRGILKQFDIYLFAKFAKLTSSDANQKMRYWFFITIFSIIPICILYLLITPSFFRIFMPQYIDTVNLALIYGLSLFATAEMLPRSVMKAHAESNIFYRFSIISTIIRILLIITGILVAGLTGAIIGATISILLNTGVLYFLQFTLKSTEKSE